MRCATINSSGEFCNYVHVDGHDVGTPGIEIGKAPYKLFIPVELTPKHLQEWKKTTEPFKVERLHVCTDDLGGLCEIDLNEPDSYDYSGTKLFCVIRAGTGEGGGNTFTGDHKFMDYENFDKFPGEIFAKAYIFGKHTKEEIGKQIVAIFDCQGRVFRIGYSQNGTTDKDIYFKFTNNITLVGGYNLDERRNNQLF